MPSDDFTQRYKSYLEQLRQQPMDALTPKQRLEIVNAEGPPKRQRREQKLMALSQIDEANLDRIKAKPPADRTAVERLTLHNMSPQMPALENSHEAAAVDVMDPLQRARDLEQLRELKKQLEAGGHFGAADEVERRIQKNKAKLMPTKH